MFAPTKKNQRPTFSSLTYTPLPLDDDEPTHISPCPRLTNEESYLKEAKDLDLYQLLSTHPIHQFVLCVVSYLKHPPVKHECGYLLNVALWLTNPKNTSFSNQLQNFSKCYFNSLSKLTANIVDTFKEKNIPFCTQSLSQFVMLISNPHIIELHTSKKITLDHYFQWISNFDLQISKEKMNLFAVNEFLRLLSSHASLIENSDVFQRAYQEFGNHVALKKENPSEFFHFFFVRLTQANNSLPSLPVTPTQNNHI